MASKDRLPVPDGLDDALRSNRYTAQQIADRFGRSRQWVARRAVALGLALPRPVREHVWRKAEDAILEATEGKDLQTVRKRLARAGFIRTESAIRCRRKKLQVSNRREFDRAYPITEWQELLGVGQSTIYLCVDTRHDPLPTRRVGGFRLIHEDDFRAWIVRNPSRFRLSKIPPASYAWFYEMLTGLSPVVAD